MRHCAECPHVFTTLACLMSINKTPANNSITMLHPHSRVFFISCFGEQCLAIT